MSAQTPRKGSREERIAAVYAQAEALAAKRKSAARRKREKGSCGLPPADYRKMRSASVVTRSKPRTTGKLHAG